MQNHTNLIQPLDQIEPFQLLREPLRTPLETVVSRYRNKIWRVSSGRDMSDFACHHCAILSDEKFTVFAKYSEAPDATRQFEIELAGLEYLSEKSGVLIPTPIDMLPVGNGTLFIMEALNAIERQSRQWNQMGNTLAHIHQIKSNTFGFHMNNYFGPLGQDNAPSKDWPTFYAQRRLLPRLRVAIDSGNLPAAVASQVETVIKRLPELCGPEITPTLLHGDAQQNNFISTAEATYVIDPAVYYGYPEIDLATIDYFQPVPDEFFDGYREEMPIDPGFYKRRGLWRIPGYLAGVAVEGACYLDLLKNALQGYL
jgi:protein-ribulosamine 3-kinase